ncbi:MAG: GNAT family N-acetyltransferase [Clostridiales bacterium]|nr:GNAT family N-acetyltransferase [Clostridiales bacterium]
MNIRLLSSQDKEFVMSIDKHVDDTKFEYRVFTKSGYVICENDKLIGTMFHTILWDNLPFMNLIYICEDQRGKGYGSKAILAWEDELRKEGYKMALISTQVDESAQHLYRKLGYVDCGGLLFDGTPFEQPMEMFMRKVL